jgi:hypothetical protein
MANLDRIQQLLNTSDDYQKRFLQDPVAALGQEGLLLSFEMQQDIRQQVSEAKARGVARGKGAPRKEFIVFKFAVVLIGSY